MNSIVLFICSCLFLGLEGESDTETWIDRDMQIPLTYWM